MSRRKRRRDRDRQMEYTQHQQVCREARLFLRLVENDPGYDWTTLDALADIVGCMDSDDGELLPMLEPRRPYEDIGEFDRAVLATGIPAFVRELAESEPADPAVRTLMIIRPAGPD